MVPPEELAVTPPLRSVPLPEAVTDPAAYTASTVPEVRLPTMPPAWTLAPVLDVGRAETWPSE